MSWRQFVREIERAERARQRQQVRAEREAMRNYRAMLRDQATRAKQEAMERAADEVDQFDRYLELLVSLHRECSEPWNWSAHASAPRPPPPTLSTDQEQAAVWARDAYVPTFFERWFGGAKRKRAILDESVRLAAIDDRERFDRAMTAYQQALASWTVLHDVGRRIASNDHRAYGEALNVAGAFDELSAFKNRVEIVEARPDALAFECRITDDEIVPTEEVSLTSRGKLSTKEMAKTKYHALFQDHVCSAAIRVAREALAVLPIRLTVVNVSVIRLNSSTGHKEPVNVLGAQFTHATLGRINLQHIDPSDAMANFPHRMRFKKTAGLDAVAPLSLNENWMTSS